MTLKVRILPFLTTFTQLTARLKNFLRGWLLVLSLKEGLVECATVCVKSEVILLNVGVLLPNKVEKQQLLTDQQKINLLIFKALYVMYSTSYVAVLSIQS